MLEKDFLFIYKKAVQAVTEMFEASQPVDLIFHNLKHTKDVVERATKMADHYKLSENDRLILFIAAWFHDTGYMFVLHDAHEEKSVQLMQAFIAPFGMDASLVKEIEACILSTRLPRNPTNLIQQILCDADTYHFGTKDFKSNNKKVYKEFQHSQKNELSKLDFDEHTLSMLGNHNFYTSYCYDLLNDGKIDNMKKLKKKREHEWQEESRMLTEGGPVLNEKQGTTKGMQTMLRLTSSNHIRLSEMADKKANILISVNAIIISLILSILLRKLQTDPYLTYPSIIFLTTSVATIVVAILATRPKLSAGTFAEEDIVNKKTNLMFFGNFHKMPQEKYENAMRTMMKDPDYLYSSIIQDIYSLGAVLGKKYKLVRLAYNLFMYGIVISVLAFAIASFWNLGASSTVVTNSSGSPF
jgi:predicted metal-dependent HD superfamily phosphohydrolase